MRWCLLWLMVFAVPVMADTSRPDFAQFQDVKAKKQAFQDYLLPVIQQANAQILSERDSIKSQQWSNDATTWPSTWLALMDKYRVDLGKRTFEQVKQALLSKVQVVPSSLALAQAANESAWGTSRFAVQGNNYFGQWCTQPGCGLVPRQRQAGASHEVAKFASTLASVQAYMLNLNRHRAYKKMRQLREEQYALGQELSGLSLATTLSAYSSRKQAYVDELQAMIRINGWQSLDQQPSVSKTPLLAQQ